MEPTVIPTIVNTLTPTLTIAPTPDIINVGSSITYVDPTDIVAVAAIVTFATQAIRASLHYKVVQDMAPLINVAISTAIAVSVAGFNIQGFLGGLFIAMAASGSYSLMKKGMETAEKFSK